MNKNSFKRFKFIALLILAIVSQVSAQVQYPYYVPAKTRVKRINIEGLPLTGYGFRETGNFQKLEEKYASSTAKDFIETLNQEQNCQSVLKKEYKCYEFEDTQIGYNGRIADYYPYLVSNGYFRPIDPRSKTLQVFYQTEKNQFFVRPSKAFDKVYGPFKGEPLAELKQAEFSVKKRNSFDGVKFTYLSKRWEFPKEEDAMLDRKNPDYDFAGGRMSGREIENMRLESQFFRFRLENNSEQNLYLLYFADQPEVFKLDRFPESISWIRDSQPKFNSAEDYNLTSLNWAILPKKSAVEFEIKIGCDIKLTCAAGVYLNDERSFWDEVEIIAVFPGDKRREFSQKNAPPKRN